MQSVTLGITNLTFISWERKQLRFGLLPPSLVWSDEKVFVVEALLNSQNDRLWVVNIREVPDELRYVERK